MNFLIKLIDKDDKVVHRYLVNNPAIYPKRNVIELIPDKGYIEWTTSSGGKEVFEGVLFEVGTHLESYIFSMGSYQGKAIFTVSPLFADADIRKIVMDDVAIAEYPDAYVIDFKPRW